MRLPITGTLFYPYLQQAWYPTSDSTSTIASLRERAHCFIFMTTAWRQTLQRRQ